MPTIEDNGVQVVVQVSGCPKLGRWSRPVVFKFPELHVNVTTWRTLQAELKITNMTWGEAKRAAQDNVMESGSAGPVFRSE